MAHQKPVFDSLPDALAFIERCLCSSQPLRLFEACLNIKISEESQTEVIQSLYSIHVKCLLRTLYLNQSPPIHFPESADRLKLGGHERELGHIHIDFQKTDLGWQLESIWKCR